MNPRFKKILIALAVILVIVPVAVVGFYQIKIWWSLRGEADRAQQSSVGTLVGDFTPCRSKPSGTVDVVGANRAFIAYSTDGINFKRPADPNDGIIDTYVGVPDALLLPSGRILVYFIDGCRSYNGKEVKEGGMSVAVSDKEGASGSWIYKNVKFKNIPSTLGPNPVDPNVVLLPDGSIRLFATTFSAGKSTETETATTGAIPTVISSFVSTDGGFTFSYEGEVYSGVVDPENYRFSESNWQIMTPGPTGNALSTDGGKTFKSLGWFHEKNQLGGVHEIAVTDKSGEYRAYMSSGEGIKSFISTSSPWTSWTEESGYRLEVDTADGLESCELSFPTVVKIGSGKYLMMYLSFVPGCSCGDPSTCR